MTTNKIIEGVLKATANLFEWRSPFFSPHYIIPLRQSIHSFLLLHFCPSTIRIFAFHSVCTFAAHSMKLLLFADIRQKPENFLTTVEEENSLRFYIVCMLMQSSIKYKIFAKKFVDS